MKYFQVINNVTTTYLQWSEIPYKMVIIPSIIEF